VKFYSFTDIRAAGDCAALAASLYGATVRAGLDVVPDRGRAG
jgi:hypothetical protein